LVGTSRKGADHMHNKKGVIGYKKCSGCKEIKEFILFGNNKSRKDGMTQYCKICLSIMSKLREKNVKRVKYRYIKSARDRGLEINLDANDFSDYFNSDCSYCGDKIDGVGIDRVDNSIGYLKGNVCSCCSTCNYMKRNMSKEEFIGQCLKISKKQQ